MFRAGVRLFTTIVLAVVLFVVGRLADLLGEFWGAVLGSGLLPSETTLGIGKV